MVWSSINREEGGNIEIKTADDETPLDLTKKNGQDDVVEYLQKVTSDKATVSWANRKVEFKLTDLYNSSRGICVVLK